jgi:hypothetical protein
MRVLRKEATVSLASSAVESPVAGRPPGRAGSEAQWLVLCCYLLGAVALTWQLWANPASRAQVGDPEDVDLFAWFMRYAATAVAHGHLPALVTTAMNAPRGVNLMWNTSFLFPGVVLSPVTLLAGPQVSLAIVLTLGFAGSAASLFWVLRRWGASVWAAALGGALYGFSPALVDAAIGHYNIAFAVAPPLIIDALLRLVTGRGSPVRTGVWLGLLTAAQLFTGEELLADTVLAGLLLVLLLAAGHPRAVRDRARGVAFGIGTAAAVMLLICGRALWVQFFGPLTQHGSWETLGSFTAHLGTFVVPPSTVFFHTRSSPALAVAGGPNYLPEYLGYLGWPLLFVLVAAAIRFWRAPRVRLMALACALLELFSLGGESRKLPWFTWPGWLLPWHWLQGLPVVGAILPDRLAVLADGAAAAVMVFSLDLARSAAPQGAGWLRRGLPFAVALLALLPLVPLPMQAGPVSPVPAGWQAAFARLRLASDARVLIVPVPYSHCPEPLRWQAATGQPASFAGGWFVGPDADGQATVEYFGPDYGTPVAIYLDSLWARTAAHSSGISRPELTAALAYWRPAAVVAVTSRGSRLAHVLSRFFGRPTFWVGRVLVWRR